MLAQILSGAVYGVEAYPVELEVNAGGGENMAVVVVGLPDAAVKESKDRVWTAVCNSGMRAPTGRTTINLAPADVRKEGPRFDLPMALALVATTGELAATALAGYCAVGELALSGEVRPVRGVLPLALAMRAAGARGLLVPVANAEEAAVVKGLAVYPVPTLRDAVDFLRGANPITPCVVDPDLLFQNYAQDDVDLEDVKGQEFAKRALEVAVAGGHNLLLLGPPGTGKTMLARRVPTLLPPLTLDEALETTKIHSIAGALNAHQALVACRPFRAPHHTISDAGLLGGGSHPLPGEVSLAHHGVLFLDELPEFHRNVLEVLRQPLEDGEVTIARAAVSVTFPSRFMLVAAMNPCPCGYYGDPRRSCNCTPREMRRYRNRISGPLLDRIDLHVEVPAVRYKELAGLPSGDTSTQVRARIIAARQKQQARFAGARHAPCNAAMTSRELHRHTHLPEDAQALLKTAIHQMHFSARAYDRILKVARTIADLAGREQLNTPDVCEAIQFRSLDRQEW